MVRERTIAVAVLTAAFLAMVSPFGALATTEDGRSREEERLAPPATDCGEELTGQLGPPREPLRPEWARSAEAELLQLVREAEEATPGHDAPEWNDLVRWHRSWYSNPFASPVVGHESIHRYFGRVVAPLHALALRAFRDGINLAYVRKLWVRRSSTQSGQNHMPWSGAIAFLLRHGGWVVLDPADPETARPIVQWWLRRREAFREGRAIQLLVTEARTREPGGYDGPSYAALERDLELFDEDPALIRKRNAEAIARLRGRPIASAPLGQRSFLFAHEVQELAEWLTSHPVASEGALQAAGLGAGSCHLQAFATALRAERMGLVPNAVAKVWAYGSFRPGPEFDWGFHVATAVRALTGWWVIDSRHGAIPLDDWLGWLRSADPYDVRRLVVTDARVFDTFGNALFATGYQAYREQFFDPLARQFLAEDLELHNEENRRKLFARYPAFRPAFEQ